MTFLRAMPRDRLRALQLMAWLGLPVDVKYGDHSECEVAHGYHRRVDTFAGEAFLKVMAGIAYLKSHRGSPLSGFIEYGISDDCELHRWAWSWRTDQLRVIHELTFCNRGVATLGQKGQWLPSQRVVDP